MVSIQTAAYAPEKVLDTVMPVPEDFLISELWFCKTMGKVPSFQTILERIRSTAVYTNMTMVQRLCPALELTPINSHSARDTVSMTTEKGTLELMQSTQWIYERGMHELQEAAIESFQDTPVQVHGWHWSEFSSFPVVNCKATYLTFPLPSSDKGSDRPLRENPVMSSYVKCVVIPFHPSGDWKRLKPITIPETISYKARRAQDGEMELGEGDGQPETPLRGCKILQRKRLEKVKPPTSVLWGHPHSCHSPLSSPSSNLMKRAAW